MPGIEQQNTSISFVAAEDDVAAEKVEMNGFLNDRYSAGSRRNGSFETMKALVIEKNFESHR